MRPYLPAVGAACSSARRARSPSRKMPLAVMLPEPLAGAELGGNLKFLPSSPGPGMGGSSSQVTCRNLPRFTVILFSTEPLQLPFSTHSQGSSRIQGQLHAAGRTAWGRGGGKGEPWLWGGWFFTVALDRNPHHLAESCDRPLRLCHPAAPRDNPSPPSPSAQDAASASPRCWAGKGRGARACSPSAPFLPVPLGRSPPQQDLPGELQAEEPFPLGSLPELRLLPTAAKPAEGSAPVKRCSDERELSGGKSLGVSRTRAHAGQGERRNLPSDPRSKPPAFAGDPH